MKINTYLNFPGNAEEAFGFYKSVFGGEFNSLIRFRDMPMPGAKIAKKDETKIMHIALPVGKDDTLMASDALESHGQKVIMGNNTSISLFPDSREEADKVFKALAAGGKIEMPIANQIWGDYYGSLVDKYGVRWMVNFTEPKAK
jgi:PhnB protein